MYKVSKLLTIVLLLSSSSIFAGEKIVVKNKIFKKIKSDLWNYGIEEEFHEVQEKKLATSKQKLPEELMVILSRPYIK